MHIWNKNKFWCVLIMLVEWVWNPVVTFNVFIWSLGPSYTLLLTTFHLQSKAINMRERKVTLVQSDNQCF